MTRPEAIDIVCNLFTETEVALRGEAVGAEFLAKVRLDEQRRRGVSVPDMLAMLDGADVGLALVPATKAGSIRLRDSWHVPYDRVAEVCRAHPTRLRGLAGLDPTMGMEGVRELERGVTELGFVGAHLYPHWFEMAPDHARYYPLYAKCCELDVPIMMQVGHCLKYGSAHTHPSVGRPICLDQVACDFPELRIIGIHIGYPWTEEMISVAYKHPNVYIGSDAYAPRHWPAPFVDYIRSWGQDKVLFGTDFPVIDPERARREIDELAFPPQVQAKLFQDNALRVFRLEASTGG